MAATKKKDWSELLGGGKAVTGEQEAPTHATEPPVTVLMHTIVGNPSNPRPEEDYSDDDPEFAELKASMQEIGQLQPLAVVSRPVFEKAKPEAVAQASPQARKLLREAAWVVVTGNRRLAAARQLGWTRIDIRVQDQLGDDGRIDEAVIIENIHRKALSKIAEAEYLQVMVERHGSQEEVARRIGKSQVYVSQRLALLKLAPDIQDEVDAGTLKVKEARQLAGQTSNHNEQRARVAELKAKAAEPRPTRAPSERSLQNPVLGPVPEATAMPLTPQVQNPVLNGAAVSPGPQRPDSIPEPRVTSIASNAEPAGERRQVKMPWHDGVACADIAIEKMTRQERKRMTQRLLQQEMADQDQQARTS
ncbi:ParB/RepB/Spo0J family partition protein [Streptomyces sp. 900105245]